MRSEIERTMSDILVDDDIDDPAIMNMSKSTPIYKVIIPYSNSTIVH